MLVFFSQSATSRVLTASLIAVVLFAVPQRSALAWGETGHRVVCQIAYDEVSPATRAEIDRLLDLDPDFDSFADSCLFADEPERIRWRDHFLNVSRSTPAITTIDCPLAETCVLEAVRNDFLVLLGAERSSADRLLALKLLGHWVGDVHQPMHVSFEDDRGANSNRVGGRPELDEEFANLHAIWDYTIISYNLGDDYRQIAADLRATIGDLERQAWQFDSPIEWANESFQKTIAPDVGYCLQQQGACWYEPDNMMLDDGEPWREIAVDDAYLELHGPYVALRLQQAGVRLARLLNQSLTTENNND